MMRLPTLSSMYQLFAGGWRHWYTPYIDHRVLKAWTKNGTVEEQSNAFYIQRAVGHVVDEYHDSGLSMQPVEFAFYVDRQEIARAPTKSGHIGPPLPLVNLALGSGFSIEHANNSSYMYVDHPRSCGRKA